MFSNDQPLSCREQRLPVGLAFEPIRPRESNSGSDYESRHSCIEPECQSPVPPRGFNESDLVRAVLFPFLLEPLFGFLQQRSFKVGAPLAFVLTIIGEPDAKALFPQQKSSVVIEQCFEASPA